VVTAGCPLCAAPTAQHYHRDRRREYLRCARCALVFVPPEGRLDRAAEYREYRQHRNSLRDDGYRRFLRRLAEPLLAQLTVPSRGLDFGCGPAPLLALILAERGHRVTLHDSLFCPAPARLAETFDFITASEVVEHLHRPGDVLGQLWDCLLPGGWLGIMTKLVRDREAFASWHYIRDPTHVCFFSVVTWRWWSGQHGAELHFHGSDVILLRKSPGT
jgi:SAM-dependent methyltransferase